METSGADDMPDVATTTMSMAQAAYFAGAMPTGRRFDQDYLEKLKDLNKTMGIDAKTYRLRKARCNIHAFMSASDLDIEMTESDRSMAQDSFFVLISESDDYDDDADNMQQARLAEVRRKRLQNTVEWMVSSMSSAASSQAASSACSISSHRVTHDAAAVDGAAPLSPLIVSKRRRAM